MAATAATGSAVILAEGLSNPDAILRLAYDRLHFAIASPNGDNQGSDGGPPLPDR